MHGIRAEVDASDDRMAKKIVNHTNQKVPFMLLAGDRDVEAGAVSFRFGDRTQINGVPRDEAVDAIAEWIAESRKRRSHSRTAQGQAERPMSVGDGRRQDDRTIVDHGVGEPDHLQRLWTPHRMTYIAEAPMKGGSAASDAAVHRHPARCPTRTAWWWRAASWSTSCSTSTRTTPGI